MTSSHTTSYTWSSYLYTSSEDVLWSDFKITCDQFTWSYFENNSRITKFNWPYLYSSSQELHGLALRPLHTHHKFWELFTYHKIYLLILLIYLFKRTSRKTSSHTKSFPWATLRALHTIWFTWSNFQTSLRTISCT